MHFLLLLYSWNAGRAELPQHHYLVKLSLELIVTSVHYHLLNYSLNTWR
jgi:hypothetical protein